MNVFYIKFKICFTLTPLIFLNKDYFPKIFFNSENFQFFELCMK